MANGDPNTAGNQAGPQPGKTYLVMVGSSDWTSGAGVNELVGLSLATANVGGSGQPDVRDNDATLQGNVPSISVTTGKLGQNDHTADFGFVECTADAAAVITLNCSTPSGTIGTPAVSGNTYLWTPSTGLSADNVTQLEDTESDHAYYLEKQLRRIELVGLENYLATRMGDGSGQAA